MPVARALTTYDQRVVLFRIHVEPFKIWPSYFNPLSWNIDTTRDIVVNDMYLGRNTQVIGVFFAIRPYAGDLSLFA